MSFAMQYDAVVSMLFNSSVEMEGIHIIIIKLVLL